ncbi:type II toxin-antitoxin system HicB family antitoxin [Candidatus Kuenenbacteria bacterium]|nr:type II toxin-antitoxin system HicB family antitoxin [Candidatus Kuenenbacteria bacterium]
MKNYKIKKFITNNKSLIFNAVFEKEKDGGFCVSVPSLSGCYSQGDTFEEAIKNIQEAIKLYLEDEKEEIPLFIEREFMVPISIEIEKLKKLQYA